MASKKNTVPKGRKVIYVKYVTRKNGFRDYAYNHGLKAWRITVPE